MNKKIKLIFAAISLALSSGFLSACNKNSTPAKTKVDFGYIRAVDLPSIKDLEELTYSNLVSKIEKKQSFVLALYGDEYCSCWVHFHPILTDYINEKNMVVEYMSVDEFYKQDRFGLYLDKVDMPSVAIFSKGKLASQIIYGKTSSLFNNKEKFFGYMEENIIAPSMYWVDKDTLATYIDNKKEFPLYIARSLCGDCANVNTDVLQDWNQSYKGEKVLYTFDMQPYRGTSKYDEYKTWLGMNSSNTKFGYGEGVFPTFQYRIGENIVDMIVTNNDSIVEGKLSSYFTEARVNEMGCLKDAEIKTILDGMDLDKKYVDNWRENSHDFYKEYHYPLLKLFFKTYF